MMPIVPVRADKGGMLSLAVLAAAVLTAASKQICPQVPDTGSLSFTDAYPAQPVVEQASTYFYLSCCTGSQPHINHTWYRWWNTSWCVLTAHSECGKDDWSYSHTGEDGQTFEFEDGDSISDSGSYMCSATDGKSTISRTFKLLVVDCRSNPQTIEFSKPSEVKTSVGSVFSQVCQGDFGCRGGVNNSTQAWWSYLDEQGQLHNLSHETQGHYSVKEFISEDESKKGATLTIHGVTEADFQRVFLCSLRMNGLPPAGFNLTLSEIENDEGWQKYIPAVVVGAIFIALVIAVPPTYGMCGSVVAFKVKSVTNSLPKRGEEHQYDAMLLAEEEEEEDGKEGEMMQQLNSQLQQEGYKIYAPKYGFSRGRQIDDIEKCVTVVFIVSSCKTQSGEEHFSGFSRYVSVCAESNTNIVFILTQKAAYVEWQNMSRDYKKVYKNIPRLFTIVKWPQDGECLALLKQNNFWSQVKSHLPKVQAPGAEREGERTSSGPLLVNQC